MDNKKICCIVSSGMTIRFMLANQLKALKEAGYDIWVVCSKDQWSDAIKEMGFNFKAIDFKRKISPFADLNTFFKLYYFLKKEKFDAVHTHTLKPEVYGQIAAKLAGVPVIFNTLHGFDFADDSSRLKKGLILFLERLAAKCSTKIFSISKKIVDVSIKERLAAPEKFLYLGRDIDVERFNPKKYDHEFILKKKKELNIPEDKKVIGIVARLVEEKGFLDLFKALQIVIKEIPNLMLLGVGPEEPEKSDGISSGTAEKYGLKENTIFLGARYDVEEIYPLMDIFALPSHREGLGAAILEASAMEVPVIATKTGGCPEAVNDKETGILVSVKNHKELAEAIFTLLKNENRAKEMGKRGRVKILREFSKEIISERLIGEYKKNLNNNLEQEWLEKYRKAAKNKKEEHEIVFQSKTGIEGSDLYFLENSKTVFSATNGKLLDLGCGFGHLTKIFASKGFSAYGVDYVPEIIEAAKKNSFNKNINFLLASIHQLPFENNFFDVIVCKEVFQVVQNKEQILEEMKRVLKKNGILLLTTQNSLSLSSVFRKEKIVSYNPFTFKRFIKEQGFKDIKLKGVYIMPSSLSFLNKYIVGLRINKLFNFLFFIFVFFSHSFYIEAKKQ